MPSYANSSRSTITSGSSKKPFCFAIRRPYPTSLKAVYKAYTLQLILSSGVIAGIWRRAIRRRDGDPHIHSSSLQRVGVFIFGFRPRQFTLGVSGSVLVR
jgi:hypothetical protein